MAWSRSGRLASGRVRVSLGIGGDLLRGGGQEAVGRATAGPDGTFDRCGQAGGGPVAGQDEVAQRRARLRALALLVRGGGERGPFLLHDAPGGKRLGE